MSVLNSVFGDDYLGNVLASVLDRKTGVDTGTGSTHYAYYNPDMSCVQDYYPGGMRMGLRNSQVADSIYKFGFNGQRRDDDIAGAYKHNTALHWEYNPLNMMRWNPDPVDQISISRYAVLGNNPIWFIDPDGDLFGIKGFGSSKAQRVAARKFAKEHNGEVMGLLKKSIHVDYIAGYRFIGADAIDLELGNGFVADRKTQHFHYDGSEVSPYGEIHAFEPTITYKWKNHSNVLVRASYGTADAIWVTGQMFTKTIFGDGTAYHITGHPTTPDENVMATVEIATMALPEVKSVRGLGYVKKLNAAQFSKMFKGNLARLRPQIRGKVNKGLNYLINKYNAKVPSGAIILDKSKELESNKKEDKD